MPETPYLIAVAAVSAAVTWALRALPFTIVARLRASHTLEYLRPRMPAGVMVILALYILQDQPVVGMEALVPAMALAVTVGLHLWRGNPLLSVFAGTAVNVVLTSTLFTS